MTGTRQRTDPPSLAPPVGEAVYDFEEQVAALLSGLAAGRPVRDPHGLEGMPLVALEPHPDDLVLSAGGWLAAERRPLLVISVCSECSTAHPDAGLGNVEATAVAAARREENRVAVGMLGGQLVELGFRDARRPYRPHDSSLASEMARRIREELPGRPGKECELLAPAAVTRHPDHLLVHEVARSLGCRLFWEDVAFFPTYARCVEDRRWFVRGHGADLVEGPLTDITNTLLDKARLLHVYRSQAPTVAQVCGVLRYAWAVADESGAPGGFMERSYALR